MQKPHPDRRVVSVIAAAAFATVGWVSYVKATCYFASDIAAGLSDTLRGHGTMRAPRFWTMMFIEIAMVAFPASVFDRFPCESCSCESAA